MTAQKTHKKYIFPGLFIILMLVVETIVSPQQSVNHASAQSQAPTRKPIRLDTFTPTIEQQAPPQQSGLTGHPTIPPTPPQQASTNCDDVEGVINTVSETNLRDYLQNLVDNDATPGIDHEQTRWSGMQGNAVETQYIKNHFDSSGVASSLQTYNVAGTTLSNIIGTIPGERVNDAYLVVAHMDSTAGFSNTNAPAPGADDDGSGTAAVMELARAFKVSGFCPKTSLYFIAFNAEELGLVGSTYYVQNIPPGLTIKGVINLDMIGNDSGDCTKFIYKAYNGGDVLTNKISAVNTNYGIGLTIHTGASSQGNSDHKPFWDRGIPATFGFECNFSQVYHTINDTPDFINFGQVTKVTKAVAGTIAELSLE